MSSPAIAIWLLFLCCAFRPKPHQDQQDKAFDHEEEKGGFVEWDFVRKRDAGSIVEEIRMIEADNKGCDRQQGDGREDLCDAHVPIRSPG